MTRLSILIDSGYLIRSAIMILTGDRDSKRSIRIDYTILYDRLKQLAAEVSPGASLDRIRWYSGYNLRPTTDQQEILSNPNYQATLLPNDPEGRQKGIDSSITADLIGLGQEPEIIDLILLSGDRDFAIGIIKAKQFGRLRGLRVFALAVGNSMADDCLAQTIRSEVYRVLRWNIDQIKDFCFLNDVPRTIAATQGDATFAMAATRPAESSAPQQTQAEEPFAIDDLALQRIDLAVFDQPAARLTTLDFDGAVDAGAAVPIQPNPSLLTPPRSPPDTVAVRGKIKAYAAEHGFRFAEVEDLGRDVYIKPRLVSKAGIVAAPEGTLVQLEIIRTQVITSVAAETEVEVSVGAIPNSGVIFGTILPFEPHHHNRKVLGDNGVEYFIGGKLLRLARLSHLGEGSR
ncbi:MAG: NYN domain-containing protein, partial [Alphaproteobacteria bacterium]|nr:NYN domain-containing protein [Alphaproteobacteria bacterium]